MAGVVYLADTSFLVHQEREPAVRNRYERLLLQGRVALCQLTAMEWLNTAANPQAAAALTTVIKGHRWFDVTTAAMDRAMEVYIQLAAESQHRNFSLPDLVIAATAEQNGATVLHYDSDYDRIAAVTGQPVEWVVPQGSL
ncbi:MAG TPA: PIN domain-containing protein [Kineosporiaceae bacterium]|nr:PIN domain-containing protein [Kineosporiaceae bacterium]